MKLKFLTAHGYISFQPDGRVEYRQHASIWEEVEVEGLEIQPRWPLPADGPSPAPSPAADALLGCAPQLAGLDLVRCLHEKIQPAGSLEKAFELTRRVAWGLRASGAGLLVKPAGENIVEYRGRWYSASRVCWPDGRIVKVLSDVPTTNGPTWQDNGSVNPTFWAPAIDPLS